MSSSQLSKEQPPRWLDIVLKGKSAAVKAKVMEVTTKMGIDPDDEFFVIFVALGQFMALLEKCPTQWDKLFTEFQGDLVRWEEDFRTSLSQTSAMTERLSEEILQELKKLAQASHDGFYQMESQEERLKALIQSTQSQSKSHSEQLLREILTLQRDNKKLVTASNSIMSFLSAQKAQNQVKWDFLPPQLLKWLNSLPTDWLRPNQWKVLSYLLVLIIGLGWGRLMYLPDKRLTEKMAQQTQWLLEKANRRDCLDKIKSPESPECQQLFQPKLILLSPEE